MSEWNDYMGLFDSFQLKIVKVVLATGLIFGFIAGIIVGLIL